MAKPSAIIAQYTDGTITQAQAAEALRTADWDDDYTRASMQAGGDYDGSALPDEGFAIAVDNRVFSGQLTQADREAFQAAYGAWKASQRA